MQFSQLLLALSFAKVASRRIQASDNNCDKHTHFAIEPEVGVWFLLHTFLVGPLVQSVRHT